MLFLSSPSASPPDVPDVFEVIKSGKDRSSVYKNLRDVPVTWERWGEAVIQED